MILRVKRRWERVQHGSKLLAFGQAIDVPLSFKQIKIRRQGLNQAPLVGMKLAKWGIQFVSEAAGFGEVTATLTHFACECHEQTFRIPKPVRNHASSTIQSSRVAARAISY